VIIPAYNAERYIGDALASVRGQMRDMEVLVVDDGSTDGTVKAAEAFADAFDLTVLRQKNGGPSAARNIAIQRARSPYIAFLDADDVMLPQRLATQTELLDRERDIALVHTDLMTFDDSGIIHRTRRAFSNPCGGMVLDRLLMDNFITTSTVMARTEQLIAAGMFNVARPISHDFELWLRMAARWKIGYIDHPFIQYRYVQGSVSADKLASARDALAVIEAFWREHPQDRQRYPDIHRRSIGEYLAVAGSAAAARGERGAALGYLVRSLRWDASNRRAWKSLAKVMIRKTNVARRPRPSPAAPEVGVGAK
jgi:glycosyltransferase involved in cell wall biosynthesis